MLSSLRTMLASGRVRYVIIYSFLALGLVLLLLASWQKIGVEHGISGSVGSSDFESESEPAKHLEPALAEAEVIQSPSEETVLGNLLARDWPASDLVLESVEQASIQSREQFVAASQRRYDMREEMKARAYDAPLDEQGRYVLLSNNRFFAIDQNADAGFENRQLYLHYAGIESHMEAPVVRLMPHVASRVVAQSVHASDASSVRLPSADFAMHDDALTMPLGSMAAIADAWIIQVDTISALGNGPQRYLVYFK